MDGNDGDDVDDNDDYGEGSEVETNREMQQGEVPSGNTVDLGPGEWDKEKVRRQIWDKEGNSRGMYVETENRGKLLPRAGSKLEDRFDDNVEEDGNYDSMDEDGNDNVDEDGNDNVDENGNDNGDENCRDDGGCGR